MTRASRAVMLAALCVGVLLVGIELFITVVALPQILFDVSGWEDLRRASWIRDFSVSFWRALASAASVAVANRFKVAWAF